MQTQQTRREAAVLCHRADRLAGGDVEQGTATHEKRRRVFVVDDEKLIATTLAAILCTKGYACTAFNQPMEALQAARSEPPDLLISDVVMPALSGIDLAIQLKAHCPDCRVLLLSGQAATYDLLEAARADGHDFEILLKPMHPAELLERVKSVTEHATPQ